MFNLNKKTTALKSEMLDKIAEYEDITFDFNDKDKVIDGKSKDPKYLQDMIEKLQTNIVFAKKEAQKEVQGILTDENRKIIRDGVSSIRDEVSQLAILTKEFDKYNTGKYVKGTNNPKVRDRFLHYEEKISTIKESVDKKMHSIESIANPLRDNKLNELIKDFKKCALESDPNGRIGEIQREILKQMDSHKLQKSNEKSGSSRDFQSKLKESKNNNLKDGPSRF